MSDLKKYLSDGWTTDQLDNLVDVRVSNVDKKSLDHQPLVRLCNYMDVYSNDYITSNIDFMNATADKSQISKFAIKKGDVMITKDSETPDDIGIAAVSLEDFEDVVCGYHLALFKPYKDKICGEFLAKQLGQYEVNRQFANKANGSTRYGLTLNVIKTAVIPFPVSVDKQRKIAHILTTCDTVIEQTQSAIAKYKAIKQGLLHDLFTRGLDANGHLRPSYQEAPELYKESELGMIPKEWDVKRLGDYLISLEAGVSVNSIDVSSTNYVAVLKTSAVSGGCFYPNENKVVVSKDIERVKTNPKADSIIISRMNTPALVGECGYIDKDYPLLFLPDRLWQTVFRDKESICVLWLNFLLNTAKYKKIIKDSATGTSDSMKNITKNAFYELKIPMCTINEQNEIAIRLSSLDNKIQTEETLLQKYQSIKRGLMGDLLGGRDAMHGVSNDK